jgi:hypothetical protein
MNNSPSPRYGSLRSESKVFYPAREQEQRQMCISRREMTRNVFKGDTFGHSGLDLLINLLLACSPLNSGRVIYRLRLYAYFGRRQNAGRPSSFRLSERSERPHDVACTCRVRYDRECSDRPVTLSRSTAADMHIGSKCRRAGDIRDPDHSPTVAAVGVVGTTLAERALSTTTHSISVHRVGRYVGQPIAQSARR